MALVWLCLIIVGSVVALILRTSEEQQIGPPFGGLGQNNSISRSNPVSSGQPSEFDTVLKQIYEIKAVDSPSLSQVTELSRLLGCSYSLFLTSLQAKQIETNANWGLVGKVVSWELSVTEVRDTPYPFFAESRGLGGLWVELKEGSPLFTVVCHTYDAYVLYLQRGNPVVAQGCIASVKFLGPSLQVMLAKGTLRRVPDSRIIPAKDVEPLGTEPIPIVGSPSTNPTLQAVDRSRAERGREPSYQTAPLMEYSEIEQKRAAELFEIVREQIGGRAKGYKGSFSISADSFTETVAKIVIYESGLGRENGAWPPLANGVYVLVRRNGSAAKAIWRGELLRSSEYYRRLDSNRTLGIAPKHSERFAYFRIESEDDIRAVADLLVKCASV